MYVFDTREKKNAHIKAYFHKQRLEYCEKALDVGDYMLLGGNVSVDRKKDLSELSTNLLNREDKARFMREVRRAENLGIRLVVLCEHSDSVKSIKDVAKWRNPYSPATGGALVREMYKIMVSYGVAFEFCGKRSTAKKIVEILSGYEPDKLFQKNQKNLKKTIDKCRKM